MEEDKLVGDSSMSPGDSAPKRLLEPLKEAKKPSLEKRLKEPSEVQLSKPKPDFKLDIREKQLESGLKIYYVHAQADAMAIIANVNAGPLYEMAAKSGISHLIEHMVYKGTKRRLSREEIYSELWLFGDDNDAETTKQSVPFGIKVILEDFEPALDLFSDLLYCSTMGKKEFEDEKVLVKEEQNNWDEKPKLYLLNRFYERLLAGSPLALCEFGTDESLSSITHADVMEFYARMFTPANTTLFIVGPKPFEEVIDAAEKVFKPNVERGFSSKVNTPNVIALPKNSSKKIVLGKDPLNIHLAIGNVIPPVSPEEGVALKVLSEIFGLTTSARIFANSIAYELAIILDASIYGNSLCVYTTSNHGNYQRMHDLIFDEFRQLKNLKPSKALEKRVSDCKTALRKQIILENTDIDVKAQTMLEFWLGGDIHFVNKYLEILEKVTPEQVIAVAQKYIEPDALTEVVLGTPPGYSLPPATQISAPLIDPK